MTKLSRLPDTGRCKESRRFITPMDYFGFHRWTPSNGIQQTSNDRHKIPEMA